MTIENKNYSVNDLERVKFRPDSDLDDSIVQTYDMNQVDRDVVQEQLSDILAELKKINMYFAMITSSDI